MAALPAKVVNLALAHYKGKLMTKRSILNLEKNDGNPLFLGDALGLQEYTEPKYPKLDELALRQRSQYWTETEIAMDKDTSQWKTLSKDVQDISVLNLAWQIQADSTVGRAPFSVLLPLVTNPEFEGMLVQWGTFENLHSRAYSNIFRTVFPDPQVKIDEVKKNTKAFARVKVMVDLFDKVNTTSLKWQLGQKVDMDKFKKDIYLMMVAIYALEAMQFYCSFACTFALAEQDILIGIKDNLVLIAKDEALHTQMSLEVMNILGKDPEWKSTIEESADEAYAILESVRTQEKAWSEYIFSEGRQIIGLNAGLLHEYLDYVSAGAFKAAKFKPQFEAPKHNPIPWIEKYLDPSKVQAAPQEKQVTAYRVGSTDGNVDDLDFDF